MCWMRSATVLVLVFNSALAFFSNDRLLVNMTLLRNAPPDALCLDGSLPAYNLDRGFGEGAANWLLQFEGGGWCNDLPSCFARSTTYRGSSLYMRKLENFSGILSSNKSSNPDFFNWNRVKIRYCDGGSFIGDSIFHNETHVLFFKGLKIWQSIIQDLLPRGLSTAKKALLSGCSAGGLSAFLHCDDFAKLLPNTSVKCLSDAGFFLDEMDISMRFSQRLFFEQLVTLQGAGPSLNRNCSGFFGFKYLLRFIRTPFFVLNAAYDVFQIGHILVPPSADRGGSWNRCKMAVSECDAWQMGMLQGFRGDMLAALYGFYKESQRGGMFVDSCFAHCQSELQDTWHGSHSPTIHNKTIAQAVGDWYFERDVAKEIDRPYPSDTACRNFLPTL